MKQHLEAKYITQTVRVCHELTEEQYDDIWPCSRPGHFDQLQMFTVQPLFPHHLQQVSRLDIHLKKTKTKEIEIQPVLERIF